MLRTANYSLDCPLWPDHPNQCKTILIVQRFFSSLSLIGCLFIITFIWLFRMYKYFVQRLILFLSISAALSSISFLIGDLYTDHNMCEFQAFIMQYFGWATLLWVVAITINILLVMRNIQSSKYERWFHLFCWGSSLIWATLPFIGNNYGPAGVWCWIKRDATAMRFGTWYIPIFLVIIFLLLAYLKILLFGLQQNGRWSGTYNAENEHSKSMLAKEVKPLAAFPLIYFILSIPPLIYRIDDFTHPHLFPNYTLMVFSVISAPSVGALNAIAFAFYSELLKQLTWEQVKSSFLSHFSSSSTRITHNVEVMDSLPESEYRQEISE